jgi:hypothetical protein
VLEAPVVFRVVDDRDPFVELGQRGDLRHGHQVVAPEPAHLTLDAAFLMGALDAGQAVPRLEAHVGSELHPPVTFSAGAPEHHPGDRRPHIVISDLDRGRPPSTSKACRWPSMNAWP